MNEFVLSVEQLNTYVKNVLQAEELLQNVQVMGEISGYRRYPSGHAYFTLKDEHSSVSCVMFSQYAGRLNFAPENGQFVRAAGGVGVYVKDGRYQLYVRSMQPAGIGQLYLAFEALKKKLDAEGLFAQERKRPVPFFPKRVGVVTSLQGAVLRDIVRVSQRRCPGVRIVVMPVPVQGAAAASQIARGIRAMNQYGRADVIIIGRGGGSLEDLWAFNTEVVARAIADCRVPVISAVGHETDTTISDLAADLRASTPSAAAEMAVPVKQELKDCVRQQAQRLDRAVKRKLEVSRSRAELLTRSQAMMRPVTLVERRSRDAQQAAVRLMEAMAQQMAEKGRAGQMLLEKLNALNPDAVMSRGFARVENAAGKTVTTVKGLRAGQKVQLIFGDGRRGAQILKKEGSYDR
ncbi:MAG: exodeoxyribonuclease VII large subunit [Christensenellales bacterium]|jgi:exodeoxyribonuclease VII large subunit